MRSILITGVSGLLGSNLAYALRDRYDVFGLYRTNEPDMGGCVLSRCDVLDERSFRDAVAIADPDVIIHCAAMSSVDDCQKKPIEARRQIVDASEIVSKVAESASAKLVSISTDSVYSDLCGPHKEESGNLFPVNEYGKLKLESESAIASNASSSLVLRTNFFGWAPGFRLSLAEWFLKALRDGAPISGYTDALFSSIYIGEMVRPLVRAIDRDLRGVYNLGARDGVSKYEFGCLLAECFGLDGGLISPVEKGVGGSLVPRSHDLRMDCSCFERDSGYRLPSVQQSVYSFYKDSFDNRRTKCLRYTNSKTSINYGNHQILRSDIHEVESVLQSALITQGPKVEEFEEEFAAMCGAKHAVACSNGTAALHLAMLAAEVGEGDRVVTSPNTFLASANCAAFVGGIPDFADIDPVSFCLCPDSLEANWKNDTKAVVAVDFSGQPAEMPRIAQVARSRGAIVIEDACHAVGGRFSYQGKDYKVGGHPWADMTTFSFHPVKTMTCGEGGIVVTDNDTYAARMRLLRTHGMVRDPEKFTLFNSDGYFINEPAAWHLYEMQELGYNFRLSEIHAALGLSQLRRLPRVIENRQQIVTRYDEAFSGSDLIETPKLSPWLLDSGSSENDHSLSWHLYPVRFDLESLNLTRADLLHEFRSKGLGLQVHYLPVHLQPYYAKNFGYQSGKCPVAEDFGSRCISLPLYNDLSIVSPVVKSVRSLLNQVT